MALSEDDKKKLVAARKVVTKLTNKAAGIVPKRKCRKAPAGWKCSRVAGHDGPCAAKRVATKSRKKTS